VIRHVILIRVNPSATPERIEAVRAALAGLASPGRTGFTMGPDLGLRPGNMDLAMVADFDDTESYRAYDQDPEHARIRQDLIAPISAGIERCQFEI
jgi:hypothetical protein